MYLLTSVWTSACTGAPPHTMTWAPASAAASTWPCRWRLCSYQPAAMTTTPTTTSNAGIMIATRMVIDPLSSRTSTVAEPSRRISTGGGERDRRAGGNPLDPHRGRGGDRLRRRDQVLADERDEVVVRTDLDRHGVAGMGRRRRRLDADRRRAGPD